MTSFQSRLKQPNKGPSFGLFLLIMLVLTLFAGEFVFQLEEAKVGLLTCERSLSSLEAADKSK